MHTILNKFEAPFVNEKHWKFGLCPSLFQLQLFNLNRRMLFFLLRTPFIFLDNAGGRSKTKF